MNDDRLNEAKHMHCHNVSITSILVKNKLHIHRLCGCMYMYCQ